MSDLLIVLGKDPAEAGGHSSYLRAFCLAAVRAGHTPHLFYAHTEDVTIEAPFGVLHGAASPLRWLTRPRPGMAYRTRLLAFHRGLIRRRMERFLADRPGRHIVVAPGPWGAISIDLRDRLAGTRTEIVPVAIAWSDAEHEFAAKAHGVTLDHGRWARVRMRIEYEWARRTVIPAERRAFRNSSIILSNYRSVVDLVGAATPDHAPMHLIPYASEEAFEDPWDPTQAPATIAATDAPDAIRILSLSRHDPRKGLDVLINALAILRDRGVDCRAWIVGPGALQDEHERLVTRLGLDQIVTVTGFVEDRVPYLQHTDVFVLPSTEESSGSISMLEAMQGGLAIVASDVDGIPEDVTHGEDALLVPPGDAAALAAALTLVIEDHALRARLSSRSRNLFERRFSAPAYVAATGEVIARFSAEPAPPSGP